MKKDDVVQILGNPDSETFKYKYPDEVNIISSSFTYYLKRIKKDFADKEDKMFFLYFTPRGELYWVHSKNMGLNDLGEPGRRPMGTFLIFSHSLLS